MFILSQKTTLKTVNCGGRPVLNVKKTFIFDQNRINTTRFSGMTGLRENIFGLKFFRDPEF